MIIDTNKYQSNEVTIGIHRNEHGEPLVTIDGKAAPMRWLADKIKEVRVARAASELQAA